MKSFRNLFKSFRTRVTLILITVLLFTVSLGVLIIYRFALDSQLGQLRQYLVSLARTAVLMVDIEQLSRIPLKPEGVNYPEYHNISEQLQKIAEANSKIRYIYILTKTAKKGIWQFIVDPSLPTKKEKQLRLVAYPGREYDASRFPQMLEGFDHPSVDDKITLDEWGASLSGYAPIKDDNGKAIAVLGVDIMADEIFRMQDEIHKRVGFILILGVILSLFLGTLISQKITEPIRKLVEGTRHIAREELHYQVEVNGSAEIKELAKSFNEMAINLYRSRRKLHSYFYRTVQSLVLILEARDHYTKGHSERVAEYSEKIALRMGLSQDKVELLKEIAVLHDIGKLGIEERILNKSERLTNEEWMVIRKHPIIGEDILKPVLLNKEILAVVRGHHERYDGQGYPDRLSAEQIGLFTQILSVADSYDAMTSLRAYRQALSLKEAMGELKKNSGAQFSPKVVDVFIRVLAEDV